VVLTNTDANAFYQALYYQLLDAYLGRPYRNYHQVFWGQSREQEALDKAKLDADLAQVARKPKPALPLASYAGTYAHPGYGDMTVKLEGGKLNMYFSRHPGLVGAAPAQRGQYLPVHLLRPHAGRPPGPLHGRGRRGKIPLRQSQRFRGIRPVRVREEVVSRFKVIYECFRNTANGGNYAGGVLVICKQEVAQVSPW
jgi:hypothetical protein